MERLGPWPPFWWPNSGVSSEARVNNARQHGICLLNTVYFVIYHQVTFRISTLSLSPSLTLTALWSSPQHYHWYCVTILVITDVIIITIITDIASLLALKRGDCTLNMTKRFPEKIDNREFQCAVLPLDEEKEIIMGDRYFSSFSRREMAIAPDSTWGGEVWKKKTLSKLIWEGGGPVPWSYLSCSSIEKQTVYFGFVLSLFL